MNIKNNIQKKMLIAIMLLLTLFLNGCYDYEKKNVNSSFIIIKGTDLFVSTIKIDNHEYILYNRGGIIHKVNCKFCKGKIHESNNSN